MNEAIVTKPFKGRPDDQPQTLSFEKGDVVSGDLARVAVEDMKCAKYKSKRAKKPKNKDTDPSLLGSSILPDEIEITEGVTIHLGDVVARAHSDSELSVDLWNALDDAEREDKLSAALQNMKGEFI